MNKTISIILLGLLTIGVLAASVVYIMRPQNARSIIVDGSGQVTIVPDIATINIGVHTEAEDVSEGLTKNTAQANAITSALTEMGIDKKDIQTSNFNVWPSDRYDPMTGQVTGRYFAIDNTVNVTVRDLSMLGDALTAVVNAGANSIYGITFDISDRSAAVAEARDLAIKDAQAKAKAIADSAGVNLGKIINVSVIEGSMPIRFGDFGGMAAEAAVPIAAGTLTITMQANLTFAIK